MYDDSPIPGMHPRQAAILVTVPEEHRSVVASRARLLGNISDCGPFSGALWLAKKDYDRLGGDIEALEALSRRDNHRAMASCARGGCSACARGA